MRRLSVVLIACVGLMTLTFAALSDTKIRLSYPGTECKSTPNGTNGMHGSTHANYNMIGYFNPGGDSDRVYCPVSDLVSISLVDWAWDDEERVGEELEKQFSSFRFATSPGMVKLLRVFVIDNNMNTDEDVVCEARVTHVDAAPSEPYWFNWSLSALHSTVPGLEGEVQVLEINLKDLGDGYTYLICDIPGVAVKEDYSQVVGYTLTVANPDLPW